MIKEDINTTLGIEQKKTDDAQIALSHRRTLKEKKDRDTVIFYYELGQQVYATLLKSYIYNNFSKHAATIDHCFQCSKSIFNIKFFYHYKLNELCIYQEEDINQIDKTLSFQFIGFLFFNTSYQNIQKVFNTVFSLQELVPFDNYRSVINNYLNGKAPDFKEISRTGPAHDMTFEYKMTVNNKSVTAKGRSKKEAQMRCCELFCKENFTKEQMLRIMNLNIKKQKSGEKFFPSYEQKKQLEKVANSLGISIKNLEICLTHSSFLGLYDTQSNEAFRSIGSNIENIHILLYLNKKYNIGEIESIRKLLNTNEDVYKALIKQFNLHNIMRNKPLKGQEVENNALARLYADCIKAIVYTCFFYASNDNFLKALYLIYDIILKNTDIRYIDSTTRLQEYFHIFQLPLNYDFTVEKMSFFKVNVSIGDKKVLLFEGEGSSKNEARNNASEKMLRFIYEQFDVFLLGNTCYQDSSIGLIEELLEYILTNNPDKFSSHYLDNNQYFGICDLENGDVKSFNKKISRIFLRIKDFHEHTGRSLIDNILKVREKQIIHLEDSDVLISIVISDVWKVYYPSYEVGATYNFDIELLRKRSYEELKDLLKHDGLLIKNIRNPNSELELLAVKNSPKSLFYIPSPSKEVLKYIKTQPEIFGQFVHLDRIDTVNSLVEIEAEELENCIDENLLFNKILEDKYFDIYIRAIFRLLNIEKCYIATGYFYISGLELIQSEIETLLDSGGELKLIIGSLQKYNSGEQIRNMNRRTATVLNQLIEKGCTLKTNENEFYHGKMYYFESREVSVVIMGSTNLSKTGFRGNKELDCMFIYKEKNANPFYTWFNSFWEEATQLSSLEIESFSEFHFDNTNNNNYLKTVSQKDIERQISIIPDEILRNRLTLWLEYKPSNIYEDITVAGKDYIAIEFISKSMIVLESFLQGNSYFVFYNLSITDLLDTIAYKSKTEIFEMSGMEKRGYHVREALKLELNIKSYFL